ncbi:MAG TPA: GNAT family N-acetyltransferase [Parafilimonas sp.]|nr:GNAT family N-acetyltransferase [Parafilimonas sp.]
METCINKVNSPQVQSLRDLFLHENNFQFVHNKCHLYGWADVYAFVIDNITVGYGAVWGNTKREIKDSVFEFYIIKPYRKFINHLFAKLIEASGAAFINCQTNGILLSDLLYEYTENINAEAILFEDSFQTNLSMPHVSFEKNTAENNNPNDCAYILKLHDEIVATGGLMLNYNLPYADVYYEVKESHRRKGFGSFIVQELKKAAYIMHRVPAARCNIKNGISKAALLKAGFTICGHIVSGTIIKT